MYKPYTMVTIGWWCNYLVYFLPFISMFSNRFLCASEWKQFKQLMPWKWCNCLVFTPLDNIYGKIRWNEEYKNFQMLFLPRVIIIIWFKIFQTSHHILSHRENHASCYLSIIILWHWCGSIHVCLCLHPFRDLVFFIIHLCHILLKWF